MDDYLEIIKNNLKLTNSNGIEFEAQIKQILCGIINIYIRNSGLNFFEAAKTLQIDPGAIFLINDFEDLPISFLVEVIAKIEIKINENTESPIRRVIPLRKIKKIF